MRHGSVLALVAFSAMALCADEPDGGFAAAIRRLDARVIPGADRERASGAVSRWLDGLIRAAVRRETAAWNAVADRMSWAAFRDARIAALRESVGFESAARSVPDVRITGRVAGDGFRIENLVFESRPGLLVAANLWLPETPRGRRPAFLVAHSHHRPKEQGELQDIGITWARAGCAVLVPELIGHGERSDHPFERASDWPASFRVSRQDYYFRANLGFQLELAGESLIGWMVRDLSRCVDVLAARPEVDPERIVLLGAVAGGGDPAGVTAALDDRLAAVAPFNFGGPQPDYEIPDRSERFYWFGVPYWETTRALRNGARDGFAHWVIVSSVAPRRLVYSHEFSWQRERDPAWPRIERVFEVVGRPEHLGWATGRGTLRGRPPESSHCTNIGPIHRAGIYPWLERWFGLEPPGEASARVEATRLRCFPAGERRKRAHEIAREIAGMRIAATRAELEKLDAPGRRELLRARWRAILGREAARLDAGLEARVVSRRSQIDGPLRVERVVIEVDDGVPVPMLVLSPSRLENRPARIAVVVSRRGKGSLLRGLDRGLERLLENDVTVCLVDVRGTGETSETDDIGPFGHATTLARRALLAGETMLGGRLHDLLGVLAHLRAHGATRIALWGASLAPVNDASTNVNAPHRIDEPPRQGDPLPGLLVTLAALFDERVAVISAGGLLASWLSVPETPFVQLSRDAVPPGVVNTGDLSDLITVLAPRPVRLFGAIDARNQLVAEADSRADRGEAAGKWLAGALDR